MSSSEIPRSDLSLSLFSASQMMFTFGRYHIVWTMSIGLLVYGHRRCHHIRPTLVQTASPAHEAEDPRGSKPGTSVASSLAPTLRSWQEMERTQLDYLVLRCIGWPTLTPCACDLASRDRTSGFFSLQGIELPLLDLSILCSIGRLYGVNRYR